MNRFGSVFSVNSCLDIEIYKFVPKEQNKAEISISVWSPGRRRNYTRTAIKVEGKIWRFKFEGNVIDFEMT